MVQVLVVLTSESSLGYYESKGGSATQVGIQYCAVGATSLEAALLAWEKTQNSDQDLMDLIHRGTVFSNAIDLNSTKITVKSQSPHTAIVYLI